MDTWILGYLDIWILEYLDIWIFGYLDIWILGYLDTWILGYLDTWILGVASKQLRLLHGRVRDSTIAVNSLNPQMSELVEDAITS